MYRISKDKELVEDNFIQNIKEYRSVIDCGLKEAKESIELLRYGNGPIVIDLTIEQATSLKIYGFTVVKKFEIELDDDIF